MFQVHCTKKLLDRIKPSALAGDATSSTWLGPWYATALFWKPQAALFVNEKTLLPVMMPMAPASNLVTRFAEQLALVLAAHGVPHQFIAEELAQMKDVQYVKTANRSVLGIMNQFTFQAEVYRGHLETKDLLGLSLWLAQTPCSPLAKSAGSPDHELLRLVRLRAASSP